MNPRRHVPDPVVVEIEGRGLRVFMPIEPREGWEPTRYILVHVCVILVACEVCDAPIGKLCVFHGKERVSTHARRRSAATPPLKDLKARGPRFGRVIPRDGLQQRIGHDNTRTVRK
jgi:hypothetical protein